MLFYWPQKPKVLNYLSIILTVASGVLVFLYAINQLSVYLKKLAGDRLKLFLGRFTRNLLTAILSGAIVTALLGSSSAVIIMVIALVSAEIVTFRQTMGVVMGANIGTTVSSQLISIDISEYTAIPLLIGFLLLVLGRTEGARNIGGVIFSLGLLFFGLFTMEFAVEPLKDHPDFHEMIVGLENPVMGVFTGALVTLIIQSSSAMVGMIITLAKQDLITLSAGIAVMLGAELGTCSDTIIATIGQNREAVRTGLFHLLFNILTIIVGVLLIAPFTELVEWVSTSHNLSRTIANAHMLFNISGVILFIPFVGLSEKLLMKLIPEIKV